MHNKLAQLCLSLGVVGAGLLTGVSNARADEMTFGADEAAEVGEASKQLSLVLEEGKRLVGEKKYEEASLIFHGLTEETDYAAAPFRQEAEYELANTLFRLEFYQGALSYYGRIVDEGQGHGFYDQALRGLLLLTDVIPNDSALAERLGAYSARFPGQIGNIPDRYRDTYAYLVGRYQYNNSNLEEALRLLNFVSPRSELFGKTRYIMGTTHVANYDARPAMEAFRSVLTHLRQRDASQGLNSEERRLLELTNLAMARVFYSTQQFETSLRYYSRIHRSSPNWLPALFESSWAFFQVDQFNRALGNLHTLNSPFFSDAYFPEGPILSAVIYFYNCSYPRVRSVLEDFAYVYEPLRREMERVTQANEDPIQMYRWFQGLRDGKSNLDRRVEQVLTSAVQDEQVRQRFDLVEAIDAEMQKVNRATTTWRTSNLGVALGQDLGLAHTFAFSEAGTLVLQRLQRVQRELDDLILQQKRIIFEVARAERGEIEADLRAGMVVDAQVKGDARESVREDQLYWTFDGEYWKDELGYYVFSVQSQCKR